MVRGLFSHYVSRLFEAPDEKAKHLYVQGLMNNIPARELLKVVQELQPAIISEATVSNDPGNIVTQRFLRQWKNAGSGVKEKTLQAICNFVITDWYMRSQLHARRLIVQKLQSANNERTP